METLAPAALALDLERLCPGVSRDMIRIVLRDLKAAGRVECLGRGPGAKWQKRVLPLKGGKMGLLGEMRFFDRLLHLRDLLVREHGKVVFAFGGREHAFVLDA